jgi:hypothetical protein
MDNTKDGYGHKENGPCAGWLVLTTANTAGTNDLTFLPKHGRARDKFLVIHPMNDQRCLTSAIARRSAMTDLCYILINLLLESMDGDGDLSIHRDR